MSYAGVNIQGGICYTRTGEGKQFVLTNTAGRKICQGSIIMKRDIP